LAKRFKCPFCANEDTVECKMDLKALIGSLRCRLCAAAYQMPIHHLHEPIDVFSEWLDDCEAAANPKAAADEAAQATYEEDDDDDGALGRSAAAQKPAAKNSSSAAATSIDLGLGDSEDDDE
jgi:transcription elongation factor Elf1